MKWAELAVESGIFLGGFVFGVLTTLVITRGVFRLFGEKVARTGTREVESNDKEES